MLILCLVRSGDSLVLGLCRIVCVLGCFFKNCVRFVIIVVGFLLLFMVLIDSMMVFVFVMDLVLFERYVFYYIKCGLCCVFV